MKSSFRHFKPSQYLMFGYAAIMLTGFLLLSLPFAQATEIISLDNFFIAVSAVSTTGLVSVDPGTSYTFFGELVIILLIQIGGIGYMSLGSFIVLNRTKRLSPMSMELIKSDFSLPKGFSVLRFIKGVAIFTFSIELIGAIFLYFIFLNEGVETPLWEAIFHAISAFCTAGFSLFSNSLESFDGNFFLNVVIAFLAISGAIGFIVFSDIWERLTGRKERVTFTTKIILSFTFVMMLAGAFILFLGDTEFRSYLPEDALLVSFFQSMTAITTVGFNTFPIGGLTSQGLIIVTILMLMGLHLRVRAVVLNQPQ